MRLHQLQVSAFGPFPGTIDVDLDTLSAAGLFLLTGPTGAGKTSVLDAICFALYGDVPGDRALAKRLRCDQAPEGARPRVQLDLTLSGRRLRVVRSPSWQRPKRRGSGTTTEQASVSVTELVGDTWEPRTSRLDEAGHLLSGLLGMNLAQFTQVVMLPQGRFQAFLRARSEDRHRLLHQLFRTGRFEDVERWLRDQRVRLGRESTEQHRVVADLTSRLSESAGVALPDDWDLHDLGAPADDLTLEQWARDRVEASLAAVHALETEVAAAADREHAAAHDSQRAREELVRLRELAGLLAKSAALDASAEDHAEDLVRLESARRAEGVAPVHRLFRESERACRLAMDRVARLSPVLPTSPTDLDDLSQRCARAARAVHEVGTRLRRLETIEAELQQCRAGEVELARRLEETRTVRASLPDRIRQQRAELERLTHLAAGLDGALARRETVRSRAAAHEQVATLDAAIAVAVVEHLAARQVAVAAHEHLLGIREARIASMAAELAGALAVGACCPVCGSADHPHKASPGPGSADAEAERAAQRALDDAKLTEHARDAHLRDLRTRRDLALERAGEPDGLPALIQAADAAVDEAQDAARGLPTSRAAVDAAETQMVELDAQLARLEQEAATSATTRAGLLAEHQVLDQQVVEVLAAGRRVLHDLPLDADTLALEDTPDLLAGLRSRAESAREAAEARRAAEHSKEALTRARAATTEAALAAGFSDIAEAVAAQLPADQLDALTRRTQERASAAAAVDQSLAKAEAADLARLRDHGEGLLVELSEVLTRQQQRHRLAVAHSADVQGRCAAAVQRAQRGSTLQAQLSSALATWQPLRERHDLVSRVSQFAEGKSADNRWRMRLSAYVLAWRLGQVVEAANQRLTRMSDGRYALEHSGERGAGEQRGGLSLLVRDEWSGERRDPATLSGGETFVVSLALALGLADVIAQEAGGPQLDTLFVDEGFGSLDAETLEDVLDVLDSLREGGRVVGVVSHVPEMRDRIPAQLHVLKDRSGSRLRQGHRRAVTSEPSSSQF